MKALNFKPVIFLFVLISFFGCEPEPEPEEAIYADVIFFVRNPSNCGFITVNLDGFASQTISEQEFSPTTPFCGDSDSGAIFRNLRAGTYNYSAFCDNNEVSGTFTINNDECFPIFLDILSVDTTDDDDGDDTFSDAKAVFWVAEDLGCGPIDVTIGVGAVDGVPIGGETKIITSYFNQAPDCGVDGAATFSNLSPFNTYYYLAECNGKEWTGTLSSDYGECTRIEL